MTSTDPTGGADAWTVTNVDGAETLLDVSCSSENLCVATNNHGDVLTSTDPTGGASAWKAADVGKGELSEVSCAVVGMCVAAGKSGEVVVSTDPTGGPSTWTPSAISLPNKNGDTESIEGVSCPTASLCVLVDSGSAVVTSTEPAGASAWTVTKLEVGSNALQGVSCITEELCVGIDDAGNVVTSTDPAAEPGTWKTAHVDSSGGLDGVSCPAASLCVAVDEAGNVVTFTEPSAGSGAWHVADVDESPLRGISCPTVSLCVAIDQQGDVVTSTDPTGGTGTWSLVRLYPGLRGVSCPSEHLCVLTTDESYVITSTDPAGGVNTWSPKDVDANEQISCSSVSLCVTVNTGLAPIVRWGDPTGEASSWREAYIGDEGSFPPAVDGLDVVSCAAAGLCVATSEGGGNGSPGNVIVSLDPADGAQAWSVSNVYGVPIEPPNPELPLGGVEMPSVSCVPEGGMCVVVDTDGRVMVGTSPPAVRAVNSSPPVVSGTPSPGQTLSCSAGSWTGYPSPTLSYQWLQDGTPISGADASTYTVQTADQGHGLACEVTAANSAGVESATSNTLQVPPVQAPSGGGSSGGESSGGGDSPSTLTRTLSNAFVLNGMESVATRGTVKLTLTLPGPGTVQVVSKASGAQVAGVSHAKKKRKMTLVIAHLRLTVSEAGRIVVTLVPTSSAKMVLCRRGKLRATVTITYTPEGGKPRSIVRTVTFRLTGNRVERHSRSNRGLPRIQQRLVARVERPGRSLRAAAAGRSRVAPMFCATLARVSRFLQVRWTTVGPQRSA